MAGDGRPRHCGRRADEAWPQGPYAYLPRGGICDNGEPRSRRPVAAGSPPGHPAHRAAGQWRSRSDAASPPGPVPARGGAGPDRGPGALQIAGTRPEGEGRARGKRPLPGKRRTCRVCYTPPASAATARGDVAAGRRGRIAGMTTLMLPADLAAVSSLPLAGQRAAPLCRLCVAGSMASSSQPGGAEQPVLVPLLRWSSPAQVALPAALRPARSFVPSAGRDLVAGRVVLLEAEPAGWQQGPGQRASPAGNRARQSPASAGSRTARTVPARPARQASPLGWWSRSWFRPVATVASSCHSRQHA
jgi:hypothetical protein